VFEKENNQDEKIELLKKSIGTNYSELAMT
jgi:hypothetical protein